MIKDILIVFKTHLDIGFTDYSKNVIDNYLNNFIPNAIRIGYELKDTDTPFIWTVGSWLIWEALKKDDGTLTAAINEGIITWHALPFTSHTELMSQKLFEYGLSLSERLDKKFNRKTIAAKMTDVPGHTVGMVPILQKNGIEFMHIGVNEATPMPDVPPLFRWKCGDSCITVMYGSGYGKSMDFGDFSLVFGHTLDNLGPQSADDIRNLYCRLRKENPDANIKSATLDEVAVRLRKFDKLPIVDKEIGDTWIHGAGTDPKKLGMYRELLRYFEGIDPEKVDLTDNLLLVPEHTWGMDAKKYFPYTKDYYNDEFRKYENHKARLTIERSWQEQRDYVTKAERILNCKVGYSLREPSLTKYEKTASAGLDFEISWEIFDYSDYRRFIKNYMQFDPSTIIWGAYDFIKVGLPDYEGGIYTAKVTEAYISGSKKIYKLEFEKNVSEKYGLPYFWAESCGKNLEIKWFSKKASRLPQACWLKFKGYDKNCEIKKFGRWILPESVIGSPLICAVDYGIRSPKGEVESLDAALVAPFGRRLLDFEKNPKNEDLYFNLYNNIWNTNFPLWYSEDTRFRFIIKNK